MKHFNTPSHPSHRKKPNPTARDLVIGHDNAKAINRGTSTLHLRPVRPTDHTKRYQPGKNLNVRAFVGGPTWCKVTIVTAARVPLTTALTLENARLAGHRTSTDLHAAFTRSYGETRTDRLVWVIHVSVDTTEASRLLAATGDSPGSYRLGADNRWHYTQRHDERESDRGYTSTASRALREEPPALNDADWRDHVHRNKDATHDRWVELDHARAQAEIKRAHADRGRMMRETRRAA